MSAQILQETINRPTQIIQGKPTNKPNYWVFIKKDSPNKISVLEVSEAKEGIEVVGWWMGDDKAVARIEKNARKEGGQILIEGDFSPTAADLSDFQPDTNTISPDTGRVNFAPAASGSSLDEARAIVHPFLYGRFRKIAQKLEQSLGGKDALQAAKRLAALARLHARAGAAERGASSRISGEVSQAGDLGDLGQTPSSQAPSTPAINDPTVPLHSRLRAYLLYADIEQKFSHAKDLAHLEKRAGREGGLVLISDASAPVAVGLSDVPSGNLNTTQNTALVNAATKLQALISDRTDFAVLTPGSRERFTLLNALNAADINSGTLGLWGQAARGDLASVLLTAGPSGRVKVLTGSGGSLSFTKMSPG